MHQNTNTSTKPSLSPASSIGLHYQNISQTCNIQSSQQKKQVLKQDHEYSMILAFERLQKIIKELPCHQILDFQLSSAISCDNLIQIKAAEMREALQNSIKNCTQNYLSRASQKPKKTIHEDLDCQIQRIQPLFNMSSEIQKRIDQILIQCITFLKNKYVHKKVYQHLRLSFKGQIIKDIISFIQSNLLKAQNKADPKEAASRCKVYAQQENFQIELQQNELKGESDSLAALRLIIPKLNCSVSTKNQLASIFKRYLQMIADKQNQLSQWAGCSQQMKQIILNQIKVISNQTAQNNQLKQQISSLKGQLTFLESKCQTLERTIDKLQKDLNSLKKDSELAVRQLNYYINPYWQKDQIEEKLLFQVIQLQSDLLIQKRQINNISEAMLQVFKITHYALDELRASKYFKYSVDRKFSAAIKHLKCFQSIDLDQVLSLKQEVHSNEESDCMTEMRRSTISTFSERNSCQRHNQLTQIGEEVVFQNQQ